jgi:hypothetical protein
MLEMLESTAVNSPVCVMSNLVNQSDMSVFLVMNTVIKINVHPKMCKCHVELSYYKFV